MSVTCLVKNRAVKHLLAKAIFFLFIFKKEPTFVLHYSKLAMKEKAVNLFSDLLDIKSALHDILFWHVKGPCLQLLMNTFLFHPPTLPFTTALRLESE